MLLCPGCSAEIPDGGLTCPACGMPFESISPTLCDLPTPAFGEHGGSSGTSEPRGPRFATGTMLASRYRIVTALGQGGMGEVYRADDLKLNQTVALKFLPAARAADVAELARLREEVRLARQISHPHVCRVFDLAEIDAHSFLCMEYIDGEDLASLLRRIGRLPVDKALEIARQLTAGLSAIHDGGLLHRDLKPGNVMIDGRGRARITDFGLAVLADDPGGGRRAGTPAYMAPELRMGEEASVRSDLYALGLVLYEMLTGQRAPERPELPASVAEGVDPRTRTVLLRCLEPDPDRRPASALQVSAALTGRDPLALAVADGLTLSPEAVAAAPQAGSLRPATATSLLVATLACLGAVLALSGRVQPFRQVPSELPPDVLTDRARSLLHEIGYTSSTRDWASGFSFEAAYSRYLATELSSIQTRRLLAAGRPPIYTFWYRTSPGLLLPAGLSVTPEDPPRNDAEQAYVELDLGGRLQHLEATPTRRTAAERTIRSPPNWLFLLADAGFDSTRLKAIQPLLVPPVFADSRAAWEGDYPGGPSRPPIPVHIEAAAFQGTPVWFNVTGPWDRYKDPQPGQEETGARVLHAIRLVFEWTALLTGFSLARRNLRLGRGDLRGAFRLAVFAFSVALLSWLIEGRHALIQIETSFNRELAKSLEASLLAWMFYLGFEPHVRRLWPERIISWNRLLIGRVRDPMVGRDVLVGCLFGLGATLLSYAGELPKNHVLQRPWPETLSGGLQGPAQHLIDILFSGVFISLEFMLFLLVLRILLRWEGLAIAIPWMLLTWGFALQGGPYSGLSLACAGLEAGLLVAAWIRFGPLAGTVGWMTVMLCHHYPLTLDTSVWYADSGLLAVLTITALAFYGFTVAVAGQPWFGRSGVLDD